MTQGHINFFQDGGADFSDLVDTWPDLDLLPEPGDTIVLRGKSYLVTKILWRYGTVYQGGSAFESIQNVRMPFVSVRQVFSQEEVMELLRVCVDDLKGVLMALGVNVVQSESESGLDPMDYEDDWDMIDELERRLFEKDELQADFVRSYNSMGDFLRDHGHRICGDLEKRHRELGESMQNIGILGVRL